MSYANLPGTTIEVNLAQRGAAKTILDQMFLMGGLVLSQVSSLTGIEPYVLQNWVKRGFLSSPVSKKYSKRQFCRIAIINFLRDSLQIDTIVKLIGYVNGSLNDESDDLIDDSDLYDLFIDVLSYAGEDEEKIDKAIEKVLPESNDPYNIAGRKISTVLKIMSLLYFSYRLKNKAELILLTETTLTEEGNLW